MNGNDQQGDGTLEHPFRTFQRAICAVPTTIPPGKEYIVDLTGLGLEILPADFSMPSIEAPFAFDLQAGPFVLKTGLQIIATPQSASNVPLADTIIGPGDLASFVPDPDTQLMVVTVTVARPAWAANALKGKIFHADLFGFSFSAAIYGSSSTQIFTTLRSSASTPLLAPPFTVLEPSVELRTTSTLGGGVEPNGFRIPNGGSILFGGIKFTQTTPGATVAALQITGSRTIFFESCDIQGTYATHTSFFDLFLATTLRDRIVHAEVGTIFSASLLTDVPTIHLPSGNGGATIYFDGFMLDNCVELGSRNPPTLPNTDRGTPSFFYLAGGLIRGTTPDVIFPVETTPPPFMHPATGCGVLFKGQNGFFDHVRIDGATGDGVHCEFGHGLLQTIHLTGSGNGGAGLFVDDGIYVRCDSDDPNTITGSTPGVNDIIVGNLGSFAWAALPPFPGGLNDFAGATATGSRVFQKPGPS